MGDGCSCSRYNFTMTGAQTFDDHFSCTKNGKSDGMGLTLKGKIPDLKQPAKMEESPLESWLPSAPYWVVELGKDYEYAVVYACVSYAGEYIYIFHREADAITKGLIDLEGIRGRLRSQGIDESQIKVVQQPSSCVYGNGNADTRAEAALLV